MLHVAYDLLLGRTPYIPSSDTAVAFEPQGSALSHINLLLAHQSSPRIIATQWTASMAFGILEDYHMEVVPGTVRRSHPEAALPLLTAWLGTPPPTKRSYARARRCSRASPEAWIRKVQSHRARTTTVGQPE